MAAVVISLDRDPAQSARVFAWLSREPRIVVGSMERGFVPLVVDTDSPREGARLMEALAEVPGVLSVEVVRIDFSTFEEA